MPLLSAKPEDDGMRAQALRDSFHKRFCQHNLNQRSEEKERQMAEGGKIGSGWTKFFLVVIVIVFLVGLGLHVYSALAGLNKNIAKMEFEVSEAKEATPILRKEPEVKVSWHGQDRVEFFAENVTVYEERANVRLVVIGERGIESDKRTWLHIYYLDRTKLPTRISVLDQGNDNAVDSLTAGDYEYARNRDTELVFQKASALVASFKKQFQASKVIEQGSPVVLDPFRRQPYN